MTYDPSLMERLAAFIKAKNGIADKSKLTEAVKTEFSLTRDRSVYYCEGFAIRFGWNGRDNSKRVGNTVLCLKTILKYDDRPIFFCIVTHAQNHLMLINTTFLKKVSHSSHGLTMDHIQGSINCSDIMMEYDTIENCPENFERLYAYHAGVSTRDNLERLVESTGGIVGRIPKFNVTDTIREQIMDSVRRTADFVGSDDYHKLKSDLDERVSEAREVIAKASAFDNVNIRGRMIEYLITDSDPDVTAQITDALVNNKPLPEFKTEDKLGDFQKEYPQFITATDIKTKILSSDSNPKAYNVDKMLEFLSAPKSVFLIYILGIGDDGQMISRLCSTLDERLISATVVQPHWAGRNTRGVTQFIGRTLKDILDGPDMSRIDAEAACRFLDELIAR